MAKEIVDVLNNYVAVLNELNAALNNENVKIETEIVKPPARMGLSEVHVLLWQARTIIEEFQKMLKRGNTPSVLKVKYESAIIIFNRAVAAVFRAIEKAENKEKIHEQ